MRVKCEKEKWLPIKDYENCYVVSNTGIVKSLKRVNEYGYHLKEHIMHQTIDRNGYCKVYLTKYGKSKSKLVHRLVAEAFIPNPNNFPEINHKDENKANNMVDNLEWCTHKYNSNYGTRTSKIIPKTIEKTRKPVKQIDEDGNVIKIWYSMNEASRKLGIIQQNISKCCQGTRQHAGGYKWEYADKKEGDK